jgi:subtilisin family serine protease
MIKTTSKNFIILPPTGMRDTAIAPQVSHFLNVLSNNLSSARSVSLKARSFKTSKKDIQVKVIDSIHEDGAKLVNIDESSLAEFRMSYPGLRIIPEVFYDVERIPQVRVESKPQTARAAIKTDILVTGEDDSPVKGAAVIVFTDFEARQGVQGVTNAKGIVALPIPQPKKVDCIFIYPAHSFWPYTEKSPKMNGNPITFKLTKIDLGFIDSLKHFYPVKKLSPIDQPVTIGIIDSGVGPHRDLPVIEGKNMIRDQDASAFEDVFGHGTHVAGIIGANAAPPSGMRGLAAGTKIRSYRVFESESSGASNFNIMKAIDQAVTDGCDLLNLSLGGPKSDPAVAAAIADAYNKGVICFIAAGNDGRQPVSYPAAAQFSVAISALGRKGLWPKNSTQVSTIKGPVSTTDKDNFIADFSNIGPQISLTAPGVGIMSTFPADLYAVMDGTSMACPAAAGAAARLLAANPAIFTAARDINRSNEMMKLFSRNAASMGFPSNFEGKGLLK